ncbi:DNA-binding PadR family transcriptional regulator [Kineococcus radiotolerans]|uniref:Transcriptional regulator, PadR-like family n=2 Tax=Kineococcus radiotolerans TaxID=131568 RepID=A6WDT4_KINRD|nr:PadR family transcriptional regulator [Kineococcus radiotolerans]ABS04973.1 transcriptional regulator, PadR-like family [Kineococcus radiotolerans SRS30216 = ATCC BAA-149]MBB2901818.1 DNA-binding PadR family transcriptional regulator [Kineococcus radiotolerans]
MVRKRGDVLLLAVLALLADGPLHGYEVRKRLDLRLGVFRALSYGTLYPALRALQAGGCITETTQERLPGTVSPKRARVVYEITAHGRDRLAAMLDESGPEAWEDDAFGVHFALFTRVAPRTRLRILEGRRARLLERLEQMNRSIDRTQAQLDSYALEAQRHGVETVRSEVDWLDRLITAEHHPQPTLRTTPSNPEENP